MSDQTKVISVSEGRRAHLFQVDSETFMREAEAKMYGVFFKEIGVFG